MAVTVSDASIKNQVAISIAHIHVHDNPVIKMLYHAINVTSTEAELFVIKYKESLTLSSICTKSRHCQSLKNLESFSKGIIITLLNFGNAQVKTNCFYMM